MHFSDDLLAACVITIPVSEFFFTGIDVMTMFFMVRSWMVLFIHSKSIIVGLTLNLDDAKMLTFC